MAANTTSEARHPLRFRILHEVIMLCIIFLIITGFYIHRPFIDGAGFMMNVSRGVHFFCAVVLVIAFVLRVAGMFIGRHRDWRSFVPGASDFKLLPGVLRYYGYFTSGYTLQKKYNPLQMITYCFIFVLIVFQICSGFAMRSPDGWWSWFNYGLFNNEIQVRITHYVVNWLFVMFMIIHVYLTIREKIWEIKEMHLLSECEEPSETVKE